MTFRLRHSEWQAVSRWLKLVALTWAVLCAFVGAFILTALLRGSLVWTD